MNTLPLVNRYKSAIYIFFLILISFSFNYYYAFIGVLPVDSFSTFNAGADLLRGSIPFKDYWIIKGLVLDFIQAFFFKIFDISWFSYALHASFFNTIFALASYFTFRTLGLNSWYSFFYSSLASILLYPTYGIPFTDHSAAIFCLISIYLLILAIKTDKNSYWFFIPSFLFLAFFTKQTPTGYIGILIILVSILYLILSFRKRIIFFSFIGSIIPISFFLIYVLIYQIPIENIIIQYFLFPVSLGETRLEWLFPFEAQRFFIRHKLLYLSLSVPIFLLFSEFLKIKKLRLNRDILIFFLLFGTLIIFISHQLMTINGLYIFFLIPIFSGFSHLYSSSFKSEKILIRFFLILSLISTIYYQQKYINKRDTLLLRNVDLNIALDAGVMSDKLKNLKWVTHHYPLNPEKEVKNLMESMEIIKKDNRKKMIVTDYQFLSVILSINDNSAARIWWRHHLYPVKGNQYFNYWKNFLIAKILSEKISVIYTVHPLEGEENIFQDLITDNCYSKKKLNEILTIQILEKCNEFISLKSN